jgi:hypothetical protein
LFNIGKGFHRLISDYTDWLMISLILAYRCRRGTKIVEIMHYARPSL